MRYSVGFVLALAGMTSPLSTSAQEDQEALALERNQEATQTAEPTSKEAAGANPELDWSLIEAQRPPVRRARNGLIGSAAVLAVGGVLFGVSYIDFRLFSADRPPPSWQHPVRVTGGVLMVGGAAGMIATGILLGVRKRELRKLRQAHYGTPRRAQWDLAHSRLVF